MSKVPTKVVSVRVPLWALAGCYDFLEKTGTDPTHTGYGEVVRKVLESLIEGFMEKGVLPRYDNAQLRQKFGLRTREPVVFPVDTPPSTEDLPGQGKPLSDLPRELRLQSGLTAFDIAQKVQKELDGERDPDITEDVVINPDVDNSPPSFVHINLFDTPSVSDDVLKSRSPKDRFVLLLDSDTADPIVKQAIRVLYRNLPVDLWGSEIAEQQINLLIQRHKE